MNEEQPQYKQLHSQYEPMIYYIMKKLGIYQNKQDFYQIGCIALWEASLRFDKEKGEFKSFAYSYICGRMKSELSRETRRQEREVQNPSMLDAVFTDNEGKNILTSSFITSIDHLLTPSQSNWLKKYCLEGKTPAEIASEEGVTPASVKAWRRDTIKKLKKIALKDYI